MQYCWDLFFDVLDKEDLNREYKKQVKTEAKKSCSEVNEVQEIFVLSFTKNSEILALWSSYSGSDGYNFEIDLRDNFTLWDSIKDVTYRYGAVIYNKNIQRDILKRELLEIYDLWQDISPQYRNNSFILIDALMYRINIWMTFIKNNIFQEEQEIRVVFYRPNYKESLLENLFIILQKTFPEEDSDKIKQKVNEVLPQPNNTVTEFRVRNNILYPYIKVKYTAGSICSVKVGPTNKSDKALLGVEMYLKSRGLESVRVLKSEFPLRF